MQFSPFAVRLRTPSCLRTAFSSLLVMRRQRSRVLAALCHSNLMVLPSSSPRSPAQHGTESLTPPGLDSTLRAPLVPGT